MKIIKKNVMVVMMLFVMLANVTATNLEIAYAETKVYVTATGSKYHTKKCGRGNYTLVALSDAKKMGLEPCSKCGAASVKDTSTKVSSKKGYSKSLNFTKKVKAGSTKYYYIQTKKKDKVKLSLSYLDNLDYKYQVLLVTDLNKAEEIYNRGEEDISEAISLYVYTDGYSDTDIKEGIESFLSVAKNAKIKYLTKQSVTISLPKGDYSIGFCDLLYDAKMKLNITAKDYILKEVK